MYRDTEGRLHLSRRDALKIAGATVVGGGVSLLVPNKIVNAIDGVNCDETATPTSTEIPPNTPTSTKTEKPTETPCPTDTPEPTITNTSTETASETPTVTASPTLTETASETPTVTASPTVTETPTNTPKISVTPSVTPTETATPVVSITPSPTETSTPTNVIPPTKTKQVNPPSGAEGINSLPVEGNRISIGRKLAVGAAAGFFAGLVSVATGKVKEEPAGHDVPQNPPKQTE